MSQESLFLLVVAVTGFMASRWMLRLAPLTSELPLKTVAATALAVAVGAGASGMLPFRPSGPLLTFSLIVVPLYIFGPLVLTALARARRYRLAEGAADLLYWTPEGRSAIKRLLVQIALQQGNAEAALAFLPQRDADQLMLAQAYALEKRWDKVLALKVPDAGDNAFLAMTARVEAYLALGRLNEAEAELSAMRERFRASEGPIGYRSIVLSEARIAAERGQFEAVRTKLESPPPGIPTYLVFDVAGRAAERAGDAEAAAQLYSQAYALAPEGRRDDYGEKLRALGKTPPAVQRDSRPTGTLALLAAIVIAFAVQSWLDSRFGANTAFTAGAFILNFNVPDSGALWRYLSYGFLHGGVVHLGFNAWVLFDIGRLFEARRNWGNLLASFVLGTVMGAYLTVVAQGGDQLILVGASGGVLGVAGALLADAWRGRTPQDKLLTRSLVQWMLIIVVFSLAVPNVSLWGHVGGLVGGLLWGFIRQGLPAAPQLDVGAGVLSIALMVIALFQAGTLLLRLI